MECSALPWFVQLYRALYMEPIYLEALYIYIYVYIRSLHIGALDIGPHISDLLYGTLYVGILAMGPHNSL